MEVCVTGGTGYIASHIIYRLLQNGYRVRTTVRNPDDPSKTGFLWDYPGAKERLTIVRADLLEEGSFDGAVAGVKGVFHVASPVIVSHLEDPEKTLLEPCLKGTLNVLRSCANSSSIKRVVITSSCSAVRYDYNRREDDPPLDESCWSNTDYCKDYQLWYAWAKTLAEKEAWRFSCEKKLDLVVVNPSFVVGPNFSAVPSSTVAMVLSYVTGESKTYPNIRIGFVHIDDVVTAHLLAYEDPGASGRLICSGEVFHWRDIIDRLKRKYPMYPIVTNMGTEEGNDIPHTMNTSKIQKMGLESFKSMEEMFDDCINSLKEHGLLW